MSEFLPDALALFGLIILVTGVARLFGLDYALMVAGLVLMVTGVAIARGRTR